MLNEKPNGLMLSLPFPQSILNPNRKAHWAKKYSAADDLRTACFYLTKQRGVELDSEKHYTAAITFCPPDNRRRDRDNLLAAYKAGLDGMCRALGIDDSTLHPIPEIGPVVRLGKVEIVIKEIKKIAT